MNLVQKNEVKCCTKNYKLKKFKSENLGIEKKKHLIKNPQINSIINKNFSMMKIYSKPIKEPVFPQSDILVKFNNESSQKIRVFTKKKKSNEDLNKYKTKENPQNFDANKTLCFLRRIVERKSLILRGKNMSFLS